MQICSGGCPTNAHHKADNPTHSSCISKNCTKLSKRKSAQPGGLWRFWRFWGFGGFWESTGSISWNLFVSLTQPSGPLCLCLFGWAPIFVFEQSYSTGLDGEFFLCLSKWKTTAAGKQSLCGQFAHLWAAASTTVVHKTDKKSVNWSQRWGLSERCDCARGNCKRGRIRSRGLLGWSWGRRRWLGWTDPTSTILAPSLVTRTNLAAPRSGSCFQKRWTPNKIKITSSRPLKAPHPLRVFVVWSDF